MNTMHTQSFTKALDARTTLMGGLVAAVATLLLACCIGVPQALAKQTVQAPIDVSDDITRIHVDKMDAGTHEYVTGAKMAIVELNSGAIVAEWVTGQETFKLEKALDVNKVYILREVEAPEGYEKVADTVFKVNEMEGTGITILDKDETTELSDSYKVTLYDQHVDFEKTVTKTKKTTKTRGGAERTVAPRTGDNTPLAPVGVVAGVAVALIVVLQFVKKRIRG